MQVGSLHGQISRFDALRAALDERRPDLARGAGWAAIERALAVVLAEAPGARPCPRAFAAQLEHLPTESALDGISLSDLTLAAACAGGDAIAIRAFEARYAPDFRSAARRAERHGLSSEDLAQRVHESLFLAREGGRPRIAEYAGTGSLRSWLRVVTTRLVLDHVRKRSGHEAPAREEEAICVMRDASDDPEARYLKQLYRREFATAFEASFRGLSAEHRNLLRHRYGEGLSIDQIALVHGIHRATAARRVSAAEDALHAETRRQLSESLKLGTTELASVMRMIQSQLHVSVARLLSGSCS